MSQYNLIHLSWNFTINMYKRCLIAPHNLFSSFKLLKSYSFLSKFSTKPLIDFIDKDENPENSEKMGKYYAVRNGRSNGIYTNWSDTKSQVNGYSGAQFKSFNSQSEAQSYMNGGSNSSSSSSSSSSSYNSSSSSSSRSSYGGGSSYGSSSSRSSYSSGGGSSYNSSSSFSKSSGGRSGSGSSHNSSYSGPVYTTGYLQVVDSSSLSAKTSSSHQNVYTDGSSRGNGKSGARAGVGVWYGDGDSRNVSKPLSGGEQTNQRAELTAVNEALKQAAKDKPSSLTIHSDSQYSIKSYTEWGDKWEQNGYKSSTGGSVKNQDLVKEGRQMIDSLEKQGVSVKFQHVKGHAGHEGNEKADRLATSGAGK